MNRENTNIVGKFKEDIDTLCAITEKNKKEIANILNISQEHLSKLYHGKEPITDAMITKIKYLLKKISLGENIVSEPRAEYGNAGEIMQSIGRLEGSIMARFDAMEKRIAQLEADCAELKKRPERRGHRLKEAI